MEFSTLRNKRRPEDNSPLPRHTRGTRASRAHRGHHERHLSPLQAHFVAATGEFVGTFWFLFFGYAGHLMVIDEAAKSPTPGATTRSALRASDIFNTFLPDGFSLLVSVWALYRISGGLFNPAVTLGLSLAGQLPWMRAAFLIPTQLIACIVAGAVVKVLFPGDVAALNTTLAPGMNLAQGVFAEMFFTSYLVFVVLILATEKSKDTFIAPIGIGLALFVAEIPGVYFTGGSLNPARSFGCAVASANFPHSHWVYWVGPILGAIMFIKLWHYEDANPDQDASRSGSPGH
ncbi:aquaporin-like protein [Xylariaceae sp. FL1019]|nr:aquaporin-like protein [Xylariaceae sp. FL1019]